jgi:cation transport ATPase
MPRQPRTLPLPILQKTHLKSFLILLGRWLEAKARGRTSGAIKRLLGLQPKTARVRRGGAEVVESSLKWIEDDQAVDCLKISRIPGD